MMHCSNQYCKIIFILYKNTASAIMVRYWGMFDSGLYSETRNKNEKVSSDMIWWQNLTLICLHHCYHHHKWCFLSHKQYDRWSIQQYVCIDWPERLIIWFRISDCHHCQSTDVGLVRISTPPKIHSNSQSHQRIVVMLMQHRTRINQWFIAIQYSYDIWCWLT